MVGCPNRLLLPNRNGPEWAKVGHIKVTFDYFQIQKWMLHTLTAEKGRWKKNWDHLLSFHVSLLS